MLIDSITIHNFRSISDITFTLEDYALMVGANNSGKSNIADAIQIFYDKASFKAATDIPKFETDDSEIWIDVQFHLNANEYENLKEEYRLPNNRLKVRKYLKSDKRIKPGIYGFIGEKVSDDLFYGAKNIQQAKLGKLIYIPAVSRLDDNVKLSGPSPLRELLTDIVTGLIKTSPSYSKLSDSFEEFTSEFKAEKTPDSKSLTGLENDLNKGIADWGTACSININPISENEIVKNLVSLSFYEAGLDGESTATQHGQGFQRHLIYTLIKTAAGYQTTTAPPKKKEFSPDLTLLLYEEPEAYLHPTQQEILSRSLKSISKQPGYQVLLTSHSSTFVSQNSYELPSIIKLGKSENKTYIGQIKKEKLDEIFSANQPIFEIVKDDDEDNLKEEMEAIKYFLWLNPDRCGLFFASHVLIVEGPTEKLLINYLIDKEQIKLPIGGVYVLDALGKYNIHRILNIFEPLCINHSVLFDKDSGNIKKKEEHQKIFDLIKSSSNGYTNAIESFDIDLENFLGVDKCDNRKKPQKILLKLIEGGISTEKIRSFCLLIENLIGASSIAEAPKEATAS